MSTQAHAQLPPRAVGGSVFDVPGMRAVAALALLGAALMLWRFFFGLGAVTALSDGYPWGLWIAFDVVTGTALACGGYAMAILIYILNRGRYHPLIRPAILTSALGYSLAALAITLDVGRPWEIWKIPLFFWSWNLSSALLEVALCVMAYIVVLWVEFSPALLARGAQAKSGLVRRWSVRLSGWVERGYIWIIALGMLLPTMHQSSLGTVMMLTGRKLDALWQTPWLPLLFLVSCIAMGYAAVVFESALASRAFGRRPETAMLASLARPITVTVGLFLAVRLADLLWRGQLGRAFSLDLRSAAFIIETALFAAALVVLWRAKESAVLGQLFGAALLLMLAGTVYRLDAYLVGFRPGDGWSYFPAIPELFITLGIVALEVLGYVAIVKAFPVLSGVRDTRTAAAPSAAA
jgi:Ni/Fe-hydrogenase subunit HybB-like protein